VEITRGDIWWADLADPIGSGPGYRRPVLIVQSDAFNRSRLSTVMAVMLTGNLRLLDAPGNVLLAPRASGLPRDSVANVTQVATFDRALLTERVGRLSPAALTQVSDGLRIALEL
jgi:mRNA interferase MazF